jgi:hypothetical protein
LRFFPVRGANTLKIWFERWRVRSLRPICHYGGRWPLSGLLSQHHCGRWPCFDHAVQDLFEGGTEMLDRMKAGGDLERMRCAYVCPWGKRAITGTGTNTDTGMCRKPTCQSHGINARQEVGWSVDAEVNQAGLEVAAFTIGPFVHAKERGVVRSVTGV